MKKFAILMLSMVCGCAVGGKVSPVGDKAVYQSEAPLPEGWPTPGPYNAVAEKRYPVYRAAYTKAGMGGVAFWTLFSHIKSKDIPMTAPVEKKMTTEPKMEMSAMGFLYQNDKVGQVGSDGKKIEVKDMASTRALTYAWMGDDDDASVAKARLALDTELTKRGKAAVEFRMMGYNGPGTPRHLKTWELHAVLP